MVSSLFVRDAGFGKIQIFSPTDRDLLGLVLPGDRILHGLLKSQACNPGESLVDESVAILARHCPELSIDLVGNFSCFGDHILELILVLK